MQVKNMVYKKGNDSAAFAVRRRKNNVKIDFWKDTEFQYQVECEMSKGTEILKGLLKDGYVEAF